MAGLKPGLPRPWLAPKYSAADCINVPLEGAWCPMDTTNATNASNAYLNYALWALALICVLGITVAVLVSR